MHNVSNLAANTAFNDAQIAFKNAIAEGRLSDDMASPLFAGNFMYMGNYNGKDNFKNIITRQYIG